MRCAVAASTRVLPKVVDAITQLHCRWAQETIELPYVTRQPKQ